MAGYSNLNQDTWNKKIRYFKTIFTSCRLCPRECRSERGSGRTGVCHAGADLRIASANLHFGEEPPVSGTKGSGTIFFSGCTLKCIFCQNFPISQLNNGKNHSIRELASIMINLQRRGAHNINLVSPTPYLFHFVSALRIAAGRGLHIPVVFNSGGYERVEILKELADIIDIYMPDFKYTDPETAKKYSGAADYPDRVFPAISEMFRQVGSLEINKEGIAVKGVIIRHLILPGNPENSVNVIKKISRSPFRDSYLSLMSQFFPAHNAGGDEHLSRRLRPDEYEKIKQIAISEKLENGWFQDI